MTDDDRYEIFTLYIEEYFNMLKYTPYSDKIINENAKLCRSKFNGILRSRNFPMEDVRLIDMKCLPNHIKVWHISKTNQAN